MLERILLQRSMIKLVSLADVISLLNACFGFLAVLIFFIDLIPSDEIKLRLSFSFILLAILGDGLDGMIARKTRSGELGEYLEAMADMTALGIAPSVFIYNAYHGITSSCVYYQSYLIIVLMFFLLMSIIRLASFHIIKEQKYFIGLPASASTIIVITLAYIQLEFLFILFVIIGLSLALVSRVHFPKLGLKINVIAAVLIFLALIFGKQYHDFFPIVLLLAIILYVIIGPIYIKKTKELTSSKKH